MISLNSDGSVAPIQNCFIQLATKTFEMKALPEITDGKSVSWQDQSLIGQSSPAKVFQYSNNRTLSITFHLHSTSADDIQENISFIRQVAAMAHPMYEQTYIPPPIGHFTCGELADTDIVLASYSINYGTETAWDEATMLPRHVAVQTEWNTVYAFLDLPGVRDVISGDY